MELRTEALTLLQREDRLQQIVKLVGPDVLPDSQRLILFVAEIMKDGFLAQSAFDENDMYCTPERQVMLLRIILTLYRRGRDLIQGGVPLVRIRSLGCIPHLLRAKAAFSNKELEKLTELERRIMEEMETLAKEYAKEATICTPPSTIEDRGLQYVGGARIDGPLVVVERIRDVGYDEMVEILDFAGRPRMGRVLDISQTQAVVQVLEGTTGLSNQSLRTRFLGESFRLPVSRLMLGRVFDGLGRPADGGPPALSRGTARCKWNAHQPLCTTLSA